MQGTTIAFLEPIPTSVPSVRSGMVTPYGVVLKVDRCAPEHGGGILVWFPLSPTGVHMAPDSRVDCLGSVIPLVLDHLRADNADITGINYQNGIR
jgi:hypothetical protein